MCGITGAVWTAAAWPSTGRAGADDRRAAHRGPDDDGIYVSEYRLDPPYGAMPGVALGFRRLSIIDVAGGHQPLSNEDGTVWIVFNGEIYNFRELRQRLEGAGHRFRTHSDTETIVHLYEDEGAECFRTSQRHVRRGHLGCPAAAIGLGPRPAGQEAAGLSPRAGAAARLPAS